MGTEDRKHEVLRQAHSDGQEQFLSPAGQLVHYRAAFKALEAARSTDEVKKIRDKAEALRAYAFMAKNRQLETDAAEIRIRAERRLGEMLQNQKAIQGLNRGAAAGGKKESPRGSFLELRDLTPRLTDIGIDKKLSSRAQQFASIPEGDFQSLVQEWRGRIEYEEARITTNLLRERERQESVIIVPEVPTGRYSTIVIDPPWSYENSTGRHSQAGYLRSGRVMDLTAVKDFDLQRWVADTCHLYLWVTDAYLGRAYEITDAWGFHAKVSLVWIKNRIGMGNYYRHQHEICIFAVKGDMRLKRRNASTIFEAPVTKHSEKPDAFYALVQSCSPAPYLDVFARKRRAGWDVYGDEITPENQFRVNSTKSCLRTKRRRNEVHE